VWGGRSGLEEYPPDAASYVPETATWARVRRGGLVPRAGHSAVWTGEEMIVWGGCCTAEQVGFSDGAVLTLAPPPPPPSPPPSPTPPPTPAPAVEENEGQGSPLVPVALAAVVSLAVAAAAAAAIRGRRRRR